MRHLEIIKVMRQVAASLCIVCTMSSCNNEIESGGNSNSDNGDCGSTTNVAGGVVAREIQHVPAQEKRLVDDFKQFVVLKRTKTGEKSTRKAINELCNEICRLPREQALPLLDQFADMAINQPITETSHSLRSAWFEQLFYIVHDTFSSAQYLQRESFDRWDKLFSFFDKCADEITSVEKTLPLTDSRFWGRKDKDRGMYLLGIRGDFKTWVHVMRDFYFPELSKGLTEAQKADILRRFDEFKKYMDTPPNFPGGKK